MRLVKHFQCYYYLLLNRTESTHTQKEEKKRRRKNPLTIKHHTLGLVSAQKKQIMLVLVFGFAGFWFYWPIIPDITPV